MNMSSSVSYKSGQLLLVKETGDISSIGEICIEVFRACSVPTVREVWELSSKSLWGSFIFRSLIPNVSMLRGGTLTRCWVLEFAHPTWRGHKGNLWVKQLVLASQQICWQTDLVFFSLQNFTYTSAAYKSSSLWTYFCLWDVGLAMLSKLVWNSLVQAIFPFSFWVAGATDTYHKTGSSLWSD